MSKLRHRHAAAFAAALCLAAAFLVLLPAPAQAKSYTCPRVDITADIQTDASLRVVEQRTFSFDGTFTAVWWDIGREFTVNSVRIGEYDDKGEIEFRDLPETSFNTEWRESGGPGTFCWSHDIGWNWLYVFFKESNADVVISIDYTAEDAVTAYEDCAELYWSYIGRGWDVDSRDVACSISLPVPADATPIAGDNVHAWGHGPLSGSLAFNDSATIVSYQVDKVTAGSYSDARVVFPRSWLTNLTAEQLEAYGNYANLNNILQEEQQWADQATWQRRYQAMIFFGFIALCLGLVLWALVLWMRHGRDYKPKFKDAYWRSEPEPGLNPVIVAQLFKGGGVRSDYATAGLLHLVNKGAVYVGTGTDNNAEEHPSQEYYLARRPQADLEGIELDEVDKATLHLVFDEIGRGADSLWIGTFKREAEEDSSRFASNLKAWSKAVEKETQRLGYFEEKGSTWQGRLSIIALIGVFVAIAEWSFSVSTWMVVATVITCAILYFISNIMPRRSREGTEIYARTQALERWLREFAQTGEPPSESVRYWADMAVYAQIFGIAEELMQQLHRTMPQLFTTQNAQMDGSFANGVPWWDIYDSPAQRESGGAGSVAGPFASTFSSAWTNAVGVVAAAERSSSDGGGGGGGFSGGGGGGFGGGGGAR